MPETKKKEPKQAPAQGPVTETAKEVVKPTEVPAVEKVVETPVEPTTAPVVADEKQDVSFYLLKSRKWRTLVKLGKRRTEIKGEDSIVSIRLTDSEYDSKLEFMRKHRGNRANGGTDFVELTTDDTKPGGLCLLDSLLDMSRESLLNVLTDRDPKNRALSTGAIMMKILKEKGEA